MMGGEPKQKIFVFLNFCYRQWCPYSCDYILWVPITRPHITLNGHFDYPYCNIILSLVSTWAFNFCFSNERCYKRSSLLYDATISVANMLCLKCPKAELTLSLDQLQETTDQKRMAVPVTLQYINL